MRIKKYKNYDKLNSFLYKIIVSFLLNKFHQFNFDYISITKVSFDTVQLRINIFFIKYDLVLNNSNAIINRYVDVLNQNLNLNKCLKLKKYFGYIPKIYFKYDDDFVFSLKFNEKFFLNKKIIN